MRFFNPVTKTEALKDFDDLTGCVKLANDNWFFITKEVPEGMELAVNENGEPVLEKSI